jgi:hypothetical protein
VNPGFLASYWSAGFGRFFQVSALDSHLLEGCANFTPTLEENDNPLLIMNNYTPVVISRNDKNKQLNIIKPTQTGINHNQ